MFWNKQKNKTETKSLVALSGVLDAQWEATSGQRLVEAGFRQNPVSYRCIRLVAETSASVPVRLACELCERDAARVLQLLERPQPGVSGQSLLDAVYGDLQVSGNAFLELVSGADEDVAGLQRVPVGAGIEHKVVRPHVVPGGRRQRAGPASTVTSEAEPASL